jgi:hypothetical protein
MIVFYTEYKLIGGVETLIINLATELFFHHNVRVKIICNKDSYVFNALVDSEINFEFHDINSEDYTQFLTNEDIIIRTDFSNLKRFQNIQSKFIYWEVIPTLLNNVVSENRLFFKQFLINQLSRQNGIVFMDGNSIVELAKRHYYLKNPKFLQIPIANLIKATKLEYISTNNHYKLSYVGRNVEWKIFPIMKVVDDLGKLYNFNFTLYIYTDSTHNYERLLPKDLPNVEVVFVLNTSGLELQRHLIENSQLHFAMGTSALEGAILAIPTIILDYSDVRFPENYRYMFIFETKNYSLGRPLNHDSVFGKHSIKELVDMISNENVLNNISSQSLEYALKNHEIKMFAVDFLYQIQKSTMQFKTLIGLYRLMYYEGKIRKIMFNYG